MLRARDLILYHCVNSYIRFCFKIFSASASCYLLIAVLCGGHMQGVKLITILLDCPFPSAPLAFTRDGLAG